MNWLDSCMKQVALICQKLLFFCSSTCVMSNFNILGIPPPHLTFYNWGVAPLKPLDTGSYFFYKSIFYHTPTLWSDCSVHLPNSQLLWSFLKFLIGMEGLPPILIPNVWPENHLQYKICQCSCIGDALKRGAAWTNWGFLMLWHQNIQIMHCHASKIGHQPLTMVHKPFPHGKVAVTQQPTASDHHTCIP